MNRTVEKFATDLWARRETITDDEWRQLAPLMLGMLCGLATKAREGRPDLSGLPTALMQARYVLRDQHAKRPDCGLDKLAEAVDQASVEIERLIGDPK